MAKQTSKPSSKFMELFTFLPRCKSENIRSVQRQQHGATSTVTHEQAHQLK